MPPTRQPAMTAAAAAAAAALVSALLGACRVDDRPASALPGDSPTASAAPSAAGSPTPRGTPSPTARPAIPDGAMLAESDLGGGSINESTVEDYGDALPNPCHTPPPPDSQRVLARRGVHVIYAFGSAAQPTRGTAYHVVTRYHAGGGVRYLADLRMLLSRCSERSFPDLEFRYQIVATRFAGDESMLISETSIGDYGGEVIADVNLIGVVRLRDVVIVVNVAGWEISSARRPDADRLIDAAVRRARLARL